MYAQPLLEKLGKNCRIEVRIAFNSPGQALKVHQALKLDDNVKSTFKKCKPRFVAPPQSMGFKEIRIKSPGLYLESKISELFDDAVLNIKSKINTNKILQKDDDNDIIMTGKVKKNTIFSLFENIFFSNENPILPFLSQIE